jgi:hypothetical protein
MAGEADAGRGKQTLRAVTYGIVKHAIKAAVRTVLGLSRNERAVRSDQGISPPLIRQQQFITGRLITG